MGKHALILKGGTIHSAILVTAVKVPCSYGRVYLYLHCVPYYVVSLCANVILLMRLYALAYNLALAWTNTSFGLFH